MTEAVVVGAGPNGLAAAITLACEGIDVTVLEAEDEIGGGARSSELTVPGIVHDHCSAVHPMGAGSPFLRSLELDRYGLRWASPEVDLAHPLGSADAAVLVRSIDRTATDLGADGSAWRSLFGPLAADFDVLCAEVYRPIAHVPRHPLKLARLGLHALPPATVTARRWQGEPARALFAGLAAHAFRPLTSPTSPAIGLMMAAAAHNVGWPVARGGSRAITVAMAALLHTLGGSVQTGVRVRDRRDLPSAELTLLDTTPRAAAGILGGGLPPHVRRAYERYRSAPAAFKLDLAVDGGVPWLAPDCRRAGTVHVGGTFAEIAHAEHEIDKGRMPTRPFVLVAQQYLADPSRAAGKTVPVYAYAHVPNGYSGDATAAILDQIERFAPGLRDRIVAMSKRSVPELERYNVNYNGGDIVTGANTPTQVVLRPRVTIDPYRTGMPGVFLCSAATPPGAGVHGMCGHNAAKSALKYLESG